MPEYLSKRFGGRRLRVVIAVLSLLLYIFTKVSVRFSNIVFSTTFFDDGTVFWFYVFYHVQVNLYAGGLFIQQSLGWDIYLSMIGLILVTALLTITGGLAAVIYTDTLQAVLMVGGATALTILGVQYSVCKYFNSMANIDRSLQT